ncbi:MAG TPA: hypothetical protein VFR44_09260, partial [Actinomycetota bacterium]|nr:hypothetical protein [Actinomycetota bacterium]
MTRGPIGSGAGHGVDLYWLPLGAGGHFVRLNGRVYEAITAWRERRRAFDLYHSALQVHVPRGQFVFETAWPIPDAEPASRGVVAEGPVFSRHLARLRVLRYEVRRWREGVIPDVAEAVASPQRLSDDPRRFDDARPPNPNPLLRYRQEVSPTVPSIDPGVRQRLTARFGREVETWFDELPGALTALAERWQLELGPPMPRGSVSMVFRCRMADGRRAVLKVSPDRSRLALEAASLTTWNAVHTPAVIASAEELGALLIESIEPGTPLVDASTYLAVESVA